MSGDDDDRSFASATDIQSTGSTIVPSRRRPGTTETTNIITLQSILFGIQQFQQESVKQEQQIIKEFKTSLRNIEERVIKSNNEQIRCLRKEVRAHVYNQEQEHYHQQYYQQQQQKQKHHNNDQDQDTAKMSSIDENNNSVNNTNGHTNATTTDNNDDDGTNSIHNSINNNSDVVAPPPLPPPPPKNTVFVDNYRTFQFDDEDKNGKPYRHWLNRYKILLHYVARNDGQIPTQDYDNKEGGDGFALGVWIHNQRVFYWNQLRTDLKGGERKDRKQMTEPRRYALEVIPTWKWYYSIRHKKKILQLQQEQQQYEQQCEQYERQQRCQQNAATENDDNNNNNTNINEDHDTAAASTAAVVGSDGTPIAVPFVPPDPSTFVFGEEDTAHIKFQQWDDKFQVLLRYVQNHNGKIPPRSYENKDDDGFQLGAWIGNQRSFYWNQRKVDEPGFDSRKQMTVQRKEKLESIPGWDWGIVKKPREKKNRKRKKNNDAEHDEYDEESKQQRRRRLRFTVDPTTFVFDDENTELKYFKNFANKFSVLQQYVSNHEGQLPSRDYANVDVDGFKLGQWIYKQRSYYWHYWRADQIPHRFIVMTTQRKNLLESLSEWSWEGEGKHKRFGSIHKKYKKRKTDDGIQHEMEQHEQHQQQMPPSSNNNNESLSRGITVDFHHSATDETSGERPIEDNIARVDEVRGEKEDIDEEPASIEHVMPPSDENIENDLTSTLPGGWKAIVDTDTGKVLYYKNTGMNVVSFSLPAACEEEAGDKVVEENNRTTEEEETHQDKEILSNMNDDNNSSHNGESEEDIITV